MTKPASPLVSPQSRFDRLWPVMLIALAVGAAYANSFSCPFIFDDAPAIIQNATIRDLGKIRVVLSPPLSAAGATGRPLVNLTLAINYAFGRLDVRGYHAVNLGLHILTALVLFGVLRRTLERSRFREKSEEGRILTNGGLSRFALGTATAFAITLIWAVHPLLTESVVCVIQRNELLCGLFYLLTLYCFIRASAVDAPLAHARSHEVERVVFNELGHVGPNALGCERKRFGGCERERVGWYLLSVLCCFFGMASKEVMVSAPLMVLLYDRTFVSGSFRSAWKQRWRYYLALAATWLLLAWLMLASHNRGGAVGFGLKVSAWEYLLTQCHAITVYLKLCIWPHPLVVDYGYQLAHRLSDVALPAVELCALLVATAVALRKRPAWGFLGACFFLILAPSSSVVPLVTQTIAEHRMYLPLAAVVTLLVLTLQRLLGGLAFPALLALAVVFGWLTFQRNKTYRTEEGIWRDTIAKLPDNERAHHNLGVILADAGRTAESVPEYEAAIRLKPDYTEAHYNFGNALSAEGRTSEAVAQYEEALRLKPDYAQAHNNLGAALSTEGRIAEAIAQYEEAVRLEPDFAQAHYNLGAALSAQGQIADATTQYEEAVRLKPDFAEAHYNLGNALSSEGRASEAIAHYQEALRLKLNHAEAHYNLGNALSAERRTSEAIEQYEEAVQLKPDYAQAHNNLGNVLSSEGRIAEAVAQYEDAVRLKPDYSDAHYNLGNALSAERRVSEAIAQYQEALRLKPDYAQAHSNLGNALSTEGRTSEAIAQYEEAVRLKPDYVDAHNNLANALSVEGRITEAIAQYEEALRLRPDIAAIQLNLAIALLKVPGRTDEAVAHLKAILRLQPDNAQARRILARIETHKP
jgi:protein O-mannosyl-transferase